MNKAMKRPLVIFALIFCLGIFVAPKIRTSFLLVYILSWIFLLLCFLSIKKGPRFDIFLYCLIFLFGAALWKDFQILPRCHISGYSSYKNSSPYTIKGVVDSQPLIKNNIISFVFKAEEIQFNNLRHNTCGNILVYMRYRKDLSWRLAWMRDLDYGEVLTIEGNPYRPFMFGTSNKKSYRDYLYNQGIFSVMNVRMAAPVIRLKENRGLIFKRLAFWLKNRMEGVIFKRVSFVPAGILDAMILGEKRNIPELINNSMMKSGTVHILVVSGFNVALVAFIIILSLKLSRLPRAIRFYIATPLIIIYCLMTGASTPVVRATIMAIVLMFAYLIKREADIYNSCAVALIFILMINPRQLFDIGFQLSFVSVISIVYLYPKLRALIPNRILKIKYIKFLAEGCLVSFSAWLGTMSFIACYFRIISPVTVLANIFIVPLASLITLCGFSLIAMEFVCPFLAPFFAYTSEFAVCLLLNINALLIKLPGAYFYLS